MGPDPFTYKGCVNYEPNSWNPKGPRETPKGFKGRKLDVFLTDAADAEIFEALKETATEQGVVVEVIAPTIDGVKWMRVN